jgi:hypothetical protein
MLHAPENFYFFSLNGSGNHPLDLWRVHLPGYAIFDGKGGILELTEKQLQQLKHTVGAAPEISRKNWGYRNHYCVRAGSEQEAEMMELVKLDLMEKGQEASTNTYFHCTEMGCKAAGLSRKQILKVFGA